MTHRSSPAEEIQSAIDKLTELESHGSDGQWRSTVSSGIASITNEVGRGVAHHVPAPDAALIITLHATIDAQLDLLRTARSFYGAGITGPDIANLFAEHALELARTINGGA